MVEGGQVNRRPLVCNCCLPPRGGSAAYECMRRCAAVEVDSSTAER